METAYFKIGITIERESMPALVELLKQVFKAAQVNDEAKDRRLQASRNAMYAGQKPPEDKGLLIDSREAAKLLGIPLRRRKFIKLGLLCIASVKRREPCHWNKWRQIEKRKIEKQIFFRLPLLQAESMAKPTPPIPMGTRSNGINLDGLLRFHLSPKGDEKRRNPPSAANDCNAKNGRPSNEQINTDVGFLEQQF
jgi:hypothetical protein